MKHSGHRIRGNDGKLKVPIVRRILPVSMVVNAYGYASVVGVKLTRIRIIDPGQRPSVNHGLNRCTCQE